MLRTILLSLCLLAAKGKSPQESPAVITDDQGNEIVLEQSPKGEPAALGCADGQREAFADVAKFPNIAGCLGTWKGTKSLRDKATKRDCGDDAGECVAPADLCAAGWHVCAADGTVAELRQVSADACENAGGGRFAAAISHCLAQDGCQYDDGKDASYACFQSGWCSEPVCCGKHCGEFGDCAGGVWPEKTHIPVGTDQGCAAVSSRRAGGVLCCKDGAVAPADVKKAKKPKKE